MSDSMRNVDHTRYNQIAGRSVATYLLSFLTLAILWNGQQAQLNMIGSQALYAAGALLCVINTYVSIGVIVLVQLNFAVGLKIRWLSRI